MFTPTLSGSRSRLSSAGRLPTTPINSSRRKSSLFTPAGKKSYSTTRGNKSLNVSEAQSMVTDCGPDHVLEEYGAPVPVLVTETLTLAERGAVPSVKIVEEGWAWLVCGRRLVVWSYKNLPYIKAGQCYELSLPPCDLQHRPDLIVVSGGHDRMRCPSCLAVSPDGTVRYWFNIGLEGAYTEVSAGLQGEECRTVIALQCGSCVLGTTSSTLIMITPLPAQGQVKCRPLRPPQGLLSGLGKRMSSMFGMGGAPAQTGSPLQQLLAGEVLGHAGGAEALYVLSGGNLQKWAVSADTDRMLYQFSVEKAFREYLAKAVWKMHPDSMVEFKSWILDMQLVRDGVIVLGAGVDLMTSDQLRYGLGIVHTEGEMSPQSLLSFDLVKHALVYEEDVNEPLSFRLLLPNPSSNNIFLYNKSTVLCVTDGKHDLPPEVVDFASLGAGCSDGLPLFMSDQGCLVSVQEVQPEFDSSVGDALSKTMSFAKVDTSLVATASVAASRINLDRGDSKSTQLKAAFLLSIRDALHQSQAQYAVNELFPPGLPTPDEPGSELDCLVVGLSQEMIDDYPASDPRWAESLPSDATSASVSLILIHQLDDKLKAHDLYLRFLRNVGLWDRLSLVVVRGRPMTTQMVLCEHAEKVEAAKALRDLHTEHAAVVDRVINKVIELRGASVPGSSLTSQDLFYREVSRVHEILECLIDLEEEVMPGLTPQDVVRLVTAVNTITKGMLFSATHYRELKATQYQAPPTRRVLEFLPWTVSDGPRGVRSIVRQQHELTSDRALKETQNTQEKGVLYQQLLELTDLLLDGYRIQLESVKRSGKTGRYADLLGKYEQERTTLIAPLVKHGQHERAALLAEKYCDFETLVQLCEAIGNHDKLHRYMDQFQSQGFSDFVFKWYMDAGKRGKLMTSDLASHPLLTNFLQSKENHYLSWLHDVATSNYIQAHITLKELADEEVISAAKKKTLLSLAKLTALAATDKPDDIDLAIEAVNDELELLRHQERLPSQVLETLGVDANGLRVLSPQEIIDGYIGDDNINANELDFKKALDLVQHIDIEDRKSRKDCILDIWCAALRRDRWNLASAVDPMAQCRNTIFYRTVELVLSTGMDVDMYLPTATELLACDALSALRDRKEFQHLLGTMYEHIHRVASTTSFDMQE